VGPFITIPLLMTALGGPQAMIGWIVALVIVICDGMVWSELGAAMPGSGGSFRYLRDAFGSARVGRLMAFLFVWQFVLSGPLEIASGYIGFGDYASYIWKGLTRTESIVLITVAGLINIALLYRRITSIAKLTITLWVGTLITVLAVIITGAMHFSSHVAFDFPPGAFNFSLGFFLGLGIGAHALDELHGHPLRTGIADRLLVGVAILSVTGAGLVGWFVGGLRLLPFIVVGAVLAFGYNLEWFGGVLHNAVGFGLSWGAFPLVTGYYVQHWSMSWGAIVAAVSAFAFTLAQRALSTPARWLRRSVRVVHAVATTAAGERTDLAASDLLVPLERALRALSWGIVALAAGLVIAATAR